ncbi:MAG: TonB-dependent receptor [Acidobacteria bacterium]|nr:TonB-dependent receptor [Acidobacteriota bacterium]
MIRRNKLTCCLLMTLACTAIVLMGADQAWAQGAVTTATLAGDVFDKTGAVLPGAKVTIKHEATGLTREIVSDDSGHFIVSQLPAGSYGVGVELPGFKKAVIRDVVLNIGATEALRVTLEVGALSESIDVSAQAVPTIEPTKTEVSAVIQEVQVRELPLNQRSFTALVIQQPGMVQMTNRPPTNPTVDANGMGSYISAGGLTGNNIAYLVDGVSINNTGYTAPGTVAGGDIPGVEAIQEFKVLTHNYSAVYGGAAGAVVSFATRSGTNDFHGSIYEFLRNDVLDARGPFDTLDLDGDGQADVPPFRRNQFGATFGGPIKHDKTFFFTNYEGLRQRLTTTGVGFVPSLAARNGGVGGTSGFPVIGPIRQPDGTYKRGPVAISPGVKAILDLYALPNGPDFGNGVAQVSFANRQPIRQEYGIVKIDHNLSSKDLISGRYSIIDADGSSVYNLPTFVYEKRDRLQNLLLKWTRTISPTVVNTASVGFMRSFNSAVIAPTVPLNPIVFNGNPPRNMLGTIVVGSAVSSASGGSSLSILGNDPESPLKMVKNYFPFNDDLVITRGAHTLKLGGMVERFQDNWFRAQLFTGNWVFTSLNDLLAGNPTIVLIFQDGADPNFGYRTTQFAWYGEDAWRARPNLTITMGLRHEFQVPILSEVHNHIGMFRDPNLASAEETVGTPFNNYSLKQFQPRIGIAYDPLNDVKTVIRAGAGLFNSFIPLNAFANFLTFHAPRMITNSFFGEAAAPDFNLFPPIPFPQCPSCTVPTGFPGLGIIIRNPLNSPTSIQWHLEIDRELPGNLKFGATYTGSQSYHITRNAEGNHALQCNVGGQLIIDRQRCGTAAPAFNRIAFSAYQEIYDTNASYHAMTLALDRRFSNGFAFSTNYTFAKAISESDIPNAAVMIGVAVGSQWPPDRKLDRAESVFSIRHRLAVNAIYELPFGRGKKFLSNASGITDALLGGWSINTLGTFQSGFPFSVLAGFGITGVGDPLGVPDRSNILRYNAVLGRVDRWFDPKAYALQEPGRLGDAPRNSVRGPKFSNLDFSLTKKFKATEAVGVEFRAEFFNIFNHANFGLPFNQLYVGFVPQFNRVPTQAELDALPCNLTAAQAQVHSCNPLTGRISTTVGTPRQVQFGLKVTF